MTYDTMAKDELRTACKAVGIPYSKLNNDGMRAALAALHPAPAPTEQGEVNPPGSYPDIDGWDSDAGYVARLGFSHCPHCGVHLSNGVLHALRTQLQTVQFEFDPGLPIAKQVEQVLAAVAAGEVAPDVGQTIVAMIGTLSTVRASEELELRIVQLEAKAVPQ